ncbi:MAG: GSCFA domain-containing protein, partial [Paraprevotella sp.]|nr:GSCFA domain-containing protein [Paraprevotella sp.]
QVVFTVSPYRYAKYGFHDSQLGKAVLLLAVDAVCRNNEGRCHYFPAYEIVLDELRDYRFYAEDLLHPSETAVEYIWERFSDLCFSPDARSFKV